MLKSRTAIMALALALAACGVAAMIPITWDELAGSATEGGVSHFNDIGGWAMATRLALDGAGNPTVVWSGMTDITGGMPQSVFLRRWDGSAWVDLGGSASGLGISFYEDGQVTVPFRATAAALALDAVGNPAIAWMGQIQEIGISRIYFRRWNGSSWESLGGSAASDGISPGDTSGCLSPCLALDGSGNPVVAWTQATSPNSGTVDLFVRRWDGMGWVDFGGSATGGGITQVPFLSAVHEISLALDQAGAPVVAWREWTGAKWRILLKRWDGMAWIGIGGSATGEGISENNAGSYLTSHYGVSLALGLSDRPAVAWTCSAAPYDPLRRSVVFFRRWNGAAWEALGNSTGGDGVSGAGWSTNPSLKLEAGGNPVIAWMHSNVGSGEPYFNTIYLKRWKGGSWEGEGGSSEGQGIAIGAGYASVGGPFLALDGSGAAGVAWSNEDDLGPGYRPEVFYRQSFHSTTLPTPDPLPLPSDAPETGHHSSGGRSCGGSVGGDASLAGLILPMAALARLRGRTRRP